MTPAGGTSRECCDDNVNDELLLDLFSADDCRSWLCLRAKGTGGGALFCCSEFDLLNDSSSLSNGGDVLLRGLSGVSMFSGGGDRMGVGGSGLVVSEVFRGLVTGEGAAFDTVKPSNGTVCGCRGDTSLPWRCAGAGGGFFFDLVRSGASPATSSSSERPISYEVLGDSAGASCAGSSSDCRDIDDASVLLPLSTTAALAELGAAGCGACVVCRGYGLPVRSMFLKLSTSREALLLPGAAPSAEARSSPPALWGSILASVFANGFAGTAEGDRAG
jgi:hypothetical protein